jgi:folate-binding protein YgfZ
MAATDELTAAYETCTTGCGLVDRSELGKLALTGPQAAEFLDGQLSNDIGALEAGRGCLATLLTPKGKMLGDVRVLALDEPAELLLVCERVVLQELFDRIRRGLIGWQAELHKRTLELSLLSLVGPRADEVARAAGLAVPGEAEHDSAGRLVRTDVGLDVLAPAEGAAETLARLTGAGAVVVPEAAAEIVRVERGRPRFGIDADADTMPAEAGLTDRAVSFTKGCYVGQETVARLHWKGRPNRHLRGLRLSAPAAHGDPVRAGERDAGTLGTVVVSPRLGPIALALLRREVEPGDTVAVGDDGTSAEVVELPFRHTALTA